MSAYLLEGFDGGGNAARPGATEWAARRWVGSHDRSAAAGNKDAAGKVAVRKEFRSGNETLTR
jgi:hypothetical protein